MTYNPKSLIDLGKYWTDQGGVNLGVVGDAKHTYGYHCGKDRIFSSTGQGLNDYSVKTARDKKGLTDAASAIDLGKLHGGYTDLRKFSVWLVEQGRSNAPGTSMIREIIYTPDGRNVYGWNRETGYNSKPILNYGDATHLWHTHISFYRDTESQSKIELFKPYFEGGSIMGLSVKMNCTIGEPNIWNSHAFAKIKGSGHYAVRISDMVMIPLPDGKDLGVVMYGVLTAPLEEQLGKPTVPGDRKNVVMTNIDGTACVILRTDMEATLINPPGGDCTDEVKAATDPLNEIIAGEPARTEKAINDAFQAATVEHVIKR